MEFYYSGFGSHWWIFSRRELWSDLALFFRRSHGSQFMPVLNFNEFCPFSFLFVCFWFFFLKKELWYYIVSHNDLNVSTKVYFPLIPIKGATAYNYYIHFPEQLGPLTKLYIKFRLDNDLCAIYSTYVGTLLMMLDIYTGYKGFYIQHVWLHIVLRKNLKYSFKVRIINESSGLRITMEKHRACFFCHFYLNRNLGVLLQVILMLIHPYIYGFLLFWIWLTLVDFSRHELWSGLALVFRRSHGSQFLQVWNFNEFCPFSILKRGLW